MYKNSIIIKSIHYLLNFFKESYEHSLLKKFILAIYKFLYIVLMDSFIVRIFKEKQQKKELDSFILTLFDKVYVFFVNLTHKIFKKYETSSVLLNNFKKINLIFNFYLLGFNLILGATLTYLIFGFLFIETSFIYIMAMVSILLFFCIINSKYSHEYFRNSILAKIALGIINIFILE